MHMAFNMHFDIRRWVAGSAIIRQNVSLEIGFFDFEEKIRFFDGWIIITRMLVSAKGTAHAQPPMPTPHPTAPQLHWQTLQHAHFHKRHKIKQSHKTQTCISMSFRRTAQNSQSRKTRSRISDSIVPTANYRFNDSAQLANQIIFGTFSK